MRPAWVLRAGLWVYDVLAGRSDRRPRAASRLAAKHPAGQALKPGYQDRL